MRFRAGINTNTSYPSSYASSYGARSGGAVSAPAQRVGGVQVVVERREIVNAPAASASSSSTQSDWPWNQASGSESGSVSASSANPVLTASTTSTPAPPQTSNVVINVDVFGGCVYHLYSQWFFYVLSGQSVFFNVLSHMFFFVFCFVCFCALQVSTILSLLYSPIDIYVELATPVVLRGT